MSPPSDRKRPEVIADYTRVRRAERGKLRAAFRGAMNQF
jgi:hypothetical protein